MSALEKWASKQGRVIAELKTNMGLVKEGLLELKEIKEMLKDSKNADKNSEGGENFVNGEGRRERSAEIGNNFEEEEPEEESQIQGEIEEVVQWESESQDMKEGPQMSLSKLSTGGLTQPHTMNNAGRD